MSRRKKMLRTVRRWQNLISIAIFVGIFFFCWEVTGFDITEIQLSRWGTGRMAVLWNTVVCLLSGSILINSLSYIRNNDRIKHKAVPSIMMSFVSACLLTVGIFNVESLQIHNAAAYMYFFSYPLAIFVLAYMNKNSMLYSEWLYALVVSVLMVCLPLLFIWSFNGLAMAEIAHTVAVIAWNIRISISD